MTSTRPRQRLGASERREQLMDAAVAVLAARGFRGTTADGIAERAGVSKGLLWRYFDDLDDLFVQTARRTVKLLAQAVGAQVDLKAPAPEVIRAAIRGAAGLLLSHPRERAALQQIIPNVVTPEGEMRLDQGDYEELYAAQEAAIFRRGQAQGDFSPHLDPRLMAITYQGAVDAMLGYLSVHPEAEAQRHAAAVADILLDGMCRHEVSEARPHWVRRE